MLGTGKTASALCELLQNHFSPFEIVGLIDDESEKIKCRTGHYEVIGRADQSVEIASRLNVKTAIVSIDKDQPEKLIKNILNLEILKL